MYGPSIRRRAIDLHAAGRSIKSISRDIGVSRAAIREWVTDVDAALSPRHTTVCFICGAVAPPEFGAYAYLLGQYLGDGYLVTTARVPKLRICCANDYPGIAAEVDVALLIISGNRPGYVQRIGCTDRYSLWKHWRCLLPQHGPGLKHMRRIELEPWQQEIVDADPWPLIRGLIHSDGCRATNNIVTRGKAYAYTRYFFSNKSTDIIGILTRALDRVGVEWRMNRWDSVSIAKRRSVDLMDEHIGPKR